MNSFVPPRRILMGAGPTEIPPRVLNATAQPTIGHLDPAFVRMMEDIKQLLRYAFQTANEMTLPVSAPGSAGMEICFVNLVEPGDKVVVCRNGVFGGRMKENVERCGGVPVMVDTEWGRPVEIDKVEATLAANPDAKVLAFVHAETSTGVESDAAALCALARRQDVLTIVDTVTSLGGIPVRVDEWGADAVYAGSQKCLSCPPGLAPVTFNERAIAAVKARRTPVQSWFLDLNLILGYWDGGADGRSYHHTAPVNALYGLHEALLMLREEGLEESWARHRRNQGILTSGIEAMGLEFMVDEAARLPQLNAITVSDGIDETTLRRHLLDGYGIEIGAGLGPLAGRILRIGLMGQAVTVRNILKLVSAMEEGLIAQGAEIERGTAERAARAEAGSLAADIGCRGEQQVIAIWAA